jgi:hypothetical protein
MSETRHVGEVRGWRAWIIATVAIIGTGIILSAVAFLLLGIAVSLVWFFMILVPVVATIALVAWIVGPRKGGR